MAKKAGSQGMNHGKNRKASAKTARSVPPKSRAESPSLTHPNVQEDKLTQVNRAVTAKGNMNKHRGDRRDMSKTYSGNQSHAARGNTPRRDVDTRAR